MELSQKYLIKGIELGLPKNKERNQNDSLFQEMSDLSI